MRTVLFGLDGATYTVLEHLIARGVMPNLGRFLQRGVRATLQSTPNPLTPQAWTTLSTGRGAGQHGIYDFLRREANAKGVFWRMNDARNVRCETIWKYASNRGRRVTVLNYILTAPPEPIAGHVLPGFISGRHLRRSTYPADLFERLQQASGVEAKILGMDLDLEQKALQDMNPDLWCDWIRHHIQRERAWFGVMEHLMTHEPSDLTAIVLDGVDKIQHLAYPYLDPAFLPDQPTAWEAEVIDVCHSYFRQVDDFLGRVCDLVGDWGRVFIASDHGFTASHEVVYINKWLHDQGLLRWRGDVAEDDQNSFFGDRLADLANSIDLANTRAYAMTPSSNGIHITVPPEDYEAFRDDLIARLHRLEAPDGGRVIASVQKREEIYSGPQTDLAPDLTLTLRDHGFISVLNARAAIIPRQKLAGTHHPHGVLMGAGVGVRAGSDAGHLQILDVAPLLLHSLGLEIPGEMEGIFPAAVYDPAYLASDRPRLARHAHAAPPTNTPDPEDEVAEMDEASESVLLNRLKALGYL